MPYGLNDYVIEKIKKILSDSPAVAKAVLYGSRARGDHKPGSDLDLTLFGERLTTEELAKIANQLDDLLLPYTLDLSLFHLLEHGKLRQKILQEGVIFYQRVG